MERTEILELLRESLTIEISMDDDYECENRYVICRVSLSLDGEEITSAYDSVCVNR